MDSNKRGPCSEYLLQGSVLDESVDLLLHKLRGMCDNADDGLVKFREHEMVYSLREGPNNSVDVRVRKQLNSPYQPFTLTYLGKPELGDKNRLTTVRTCVEVNCGQNICSFLQELGFAMEFEFVSQGWIFKKAKLNARVTKVYRVIQPMNVDKLVPVSNSHLVEVSLISDSSNEAAANEVHSFSEKLKPHVNLDKFDPRRMPG